MTLDLLVMNLAAWWLQAALLVGAATAMVWVLRIRSPRFLLALWQTLLVVCLLLPVAESWQRPEAAVVDIHVPAAMEAETPAASVVILEPEAAPAVVWQEWLVGALAFGAMLRLGWLGLGLLRLKRYRRSAEPLETIPEWLAALQLQMRIWPGIAVSNELRGAVTYGVWNPWILLPRCFVEMPREQQLSVVCHELNHVARRDWLFKIAEELVVSLSWFHPAMWWLNARIQLAREQVVDQLTVETTGERQDYLDALLAVATLSQEADLVPATLFLKRRHLRRRVMEIMEESRMSKRHILTMLVVLGGTLAYTAHFAMLTFPLTAPSSLLAQDTNTGILHRTGVQYPVEARAKGIEGTVVVQVTLDPGGHVIGADVLSGPAELRQAALKSVLDWHFASPPAPGKTQVSVEFTLPKPLPPPPPGVVGTVGPVPEGVVGGVPGGVVGGVIRSAPTASGPSGLGNVRNPNAVFVVRSIDTSRLSEEMSQQVLSRLPFGENSQIDFTALRSGQEAIRSIDEHLSLTVRPIKNDDPNRMEATVVVLIQGALPARPTANVAADDGNIPQRIRVGAGAQAARLIRQPKPVYPPLARQARIQGKVSFMATIGKDGTVQSLEPIVGGHPLLVQAAQDAASQWVYQPTLLNGQPVEVVTQIDVNFELADGGQQ